MACFAFVTELYWPSLGGQEVRYRELSHHLATLGHKVEILTISTDPALPDVEEVEGTTVRRLVCSPRYKSLRARRNPWTILLFSFSAGRRLLAHRYDYVIFNQWPALPQLLFGRLCPSYTLMDWCEHRSGRLYRAVFRLCALSTQAHISVSSSLAGLLQDRYGVKKTMVIPSGIERSSYAADSHKAGLLFIGRLVHHKHPEMIIAAVDELQRKGCSISLTIAGDGPLLDGITLLARNRSDIRVLGRVSESEKRSLLASSWLHVLPSEREGFPRTIAEAMASGTPTLTVFSPDNGATAIVDEYGCGLVTDPTPAALASSIRKLLAEGSHWQQLSSAGLQNSELLDWKALSRQLVAFLQNEVVVSNTSRQRPAYDEAKQL